jgi:hypothetical protein
MSRWDLRLDDCVNHSRLRQAKEWARLHAIESIAIGLKHRHVIPDGI